jgi:hypothetical protein
MQDGLAVAVYWDGRIYPTEGGLNSYRFFNVQCVIQRMAVKPSFKNDLASCVRRVKDRSRKAGVVG